MKKWVGLVLALAVITTSAIAERARDRPSEWSAITAPECTAARRVGGDVPVPSPALVMELATTGCIGGACEGVDNAISSMIAADRPLVLRTAKRYQTLVTTLDASPATRKLAFASMITWTRRCIPEATDPLLLRLRQAAEAQRDGACRATCAPWQRKDWPEAVTAYGFAYGGTSYGAARCVDDCEGGTGIDGFVSQLVAAGKLHAGGLTAEELIDYVDHELERGHGRNR